MNLNGRFEAGEAAIVKTQNPEFGSYYSIKALKGRFLLAEEYLSKDPTYAEKYVKTIIKNNKKVDFGNFGQSIWSKLYFDCLKSGE